MCQKSGLPSLPDPCFFGLTRSQPEYTGKASVPDPTRPERQLNLPVPVPTRPVDCPTVYVILCMYNFILWNLCTQVRMFYVCHTCMCTRTHAQHSNSYE
jgi:hypothetical protein